MIITQEPEWESSHLQELRSFLASATGRRLLEKLMWLTPSYSVSRNEPTQRIIESGIREGYEHCLEALVFLSTPPTRTPEADSAYPELDSDKGWEATDAATRAAQAGS